MTDRFESLRQQGISEKLIGKVRDFAEKYGVDEAALSRLPKPAIPYFGREILEMAICALLEGENLLLAGGKATGKNVLAENLAYFFGRPVYNMSFHVNTDSSALIGTDTFRDNEVQLRKGPIALCAEYGGFGILDEINPYAGVGEDGEGIVWSDVMSDQLMEIGAASSNLLVSQETVTGIFINTSALVEAGYVDADGKAKIPTTWNEMMDACATLKKAGYTAPFAIGEMTGVAMEWVIKVYADQCYRDLLDDVQQQVGDYNFKQATADFGFSLSDDQPEYDSKYNINTMRVYNALLNKSSNSPYYVGAGSDRFNCFMSNFLKISDYLSPTFAEETITTMQQNFLAGTKDSPVFMPCYLGFGVSIMNTEGVDFEWDVIDYVPMECTCDVPCNKNGGCDHVDNDATHNECTKHIRTTVTRDVGGYGGYIGLYTYGKSEDQIALYLDFIQFFLSPYGQSCFYYGLEEGGGSPKATTGIYGTVAPAAWDSFFQSTSKVVFNGRAAENEFVQYLSFGHASYDSYTSLRTAMGNALRKGGADALKTLTSEWESSLLSTYQSFFKTTYGKTTPYLDYTKNPNA